MLQKQHLQGACHTTRLHVSGSPGRARGLVRAAGQFVATPHSGYHWDGTPRRFFEGWYWKVTIPENGQSFALIYSVEDPSNPSAPTAGVGVQVMGPDDGYICQFTRDQSTFWAARNSLELGACIKAAPTYTGRRAPQKIVSQDAFNAAVEHGFQASSTLQQGSIVANETGAAGQPFSTVPNCSWCMDLQPLVGWGTAPGLGNGRTNGSSFASGSSGSSGSLTSGSSRTAVGSSSSSRRGGSQKATAGWLSALAVFEPHWQVLMAEGRASGWLQWGSQRYEFTNAPAYAEKNWGGGFPSKWIWVVCNTFNDCPGLSLTAVGARRGLLNVPGIEEDVGMIGVHLPDGTFLEMVPWNGTVEWSADPWGRWWLRAVAGGYEAVVDATCQQDAGTVLRAPTKTEGLAPHCRDTFFGRCRLRVWRTDSSGRRAATPLVDALSSTAALEVGGGPWWSPWSATADMKEPFRTLVQLPIDLGALSQVVPDPLKPPGL